MVGNMTVGAGLCAYLCKVSHGHGEIGKWFYITEGSVFLDGRKMIELNPAFSLVLMHSPAVGTCSCLLGHVCLCLWLHDHDWDSVHCPSVIRVVAWPSGWGGIPDWGCRAGYMCAFLTWVVYMCVGVWRRGVYSCSVMCTAIIMWFCIRIWDFRCFSPATDILVDYLTIFYNKEDTANVVYTEENVSLQQTLWKDKHFY